MNTSGTILLVDDEELFRHSTAELLRNDGYICDCAENGRSAIELIRENRYDVMIADICMDGNHDLSLVRDAGHIAPSLPVILVTGHPSLETAIPSIHLSVMAYLRKPLDYTVVRDHIRQATSHSALRRTLSEVQQRLTSAAAAISAIPIHSKPQTDASDLLPISIVRDISVALTQILQTRHAFGCNDGARSVCRLLDCKTHPNYEDAILEVIDTLKRTKSSFKSKELGALRLRLESILEKPHNLPAPHISYATISQRQS